LNSANCATWDRAWPAAMLVPLGGAVAGMLTGLVVGRAVRPRCGARSR
jgi:hypothetical protein